VCVTCGEAIKADQQRPPHSALMKGFLYGLGAAIAGAILMAVVTLVTGFQIALVAIAVGYMVGTAFKKGTSGLGGRRCQILAVALTYFAITTSFLPLLVKSADDARKSGKASPQRGNTSTVVQASEAPQPPAPQPTAGRAALAVLILIGVGLISPFLMLTAGIGGILNALIIFFGIARAWRLTAADPRVVIGPFEQ